jgi:hypothetical protein
LSFRERESVTNIIKHNAKGTEAVTDRQHWLEIHRGLTDPDPYVRQQWADYDLWKSQDRLDTNDMQGLAKIQGAIRQGDPNKELTPIISVNQMIDGALRNDLRVDPSADAAPADAQKSYAYRRGVQEDIFNLETSAKRKASPKEMQDIVDARTFKARKDWGSGNLQDKYTTRLDNFSQKVKGTLQELGIDTTSPSADAAASGQKFKTQAEEYLAGFEKKYGVVSTDADQRKLLGILKGEVPAVSRMGLNTKVPLWNIKARQLPEADRAKIEQSFKNLGMEPTDDRVTKLYIDMQIEKRLTR